MAASVQFRQQERVFGMVMTEREDDDLALYFQIPSLDNLDDFDDQLGSKQDSALVPEIASMLPATKPSADSFLNSEIDKTHCDCILAPPGTQLFPSLEMESKKTVTSQIGISVGDPAASEFSACPQPLELQHGNSPAEPDSRKNETSEQLLLSTDSNSSIAANQRPSSLGRLTSTASRSATPTGRATKAKPSRTSTPTSRATLPTTAKPSRASTPTSRATFLSNKPIGPAVRSSTPTRFMVCSSTPTARPSAPAASKSMSRSATPTHRLSASSSVTKTSGPTVRSSSVTKSGPTTLKNPTKSRGASPTVKSRSWKQSEMPGFSNDAPNLKTSMPKRPSSASKGRRGAPSARLSSIETSSNGRLRRQSQSPSRGWAANGSAHNNGSSVLSVSRAHSNGSDEVSPVLIGTKMVERVVNMRKLAPPKQDDHVSKNNDSSGKSSLPSQDNFGFGRTLSKKSFDMALRHMDISRSIPGYLGPQVTNIPASSVYSVRSGSTNSRSFSISDSPFAPSSNDSSEPSVNNSSNCFDGSDIEDN